MPKSNLKQLLQIKNNPQLAVFNAISDMKRATEEELQKMRGGGENDPITKVVAVVAKEMVEREFIQLQEDLIPQIEKHIDEVVDEVITKKLLQGEQGTQGIEGKQGSTGEGIDGKDGTSGKDGKQGMNGLNGVDGKDGVDGTSVSKEEIMKELEPIIANIKISLKTSRPSTRGGGGGGMGNAVHQQFTGAGPYTLNAQVAAQGNAIWVYYNGQFLVKDTHYTVSGKVVTQLLDVAPTANENIDVTFIRA